MQKLVFILVVLGVGIGAMMPSEPTRKALPRDMPKLAASEPEQPVFRQAVDLGTGEVRLTRNDDGHFYADAQVNGAPIRFLVDTGATSIALTREDAQRASIPLEAGSQVVGMGASGKVYGQDVQLDRISLGSQEVRDVRATVLDGGEQSLLGQSFLARYRSVVIEGETMVLR